MGKRAERPYLSDKSKDQLLVCPTVNFTFALAMEQPLRLALDRSMDAVAALQVEGRPRRAELCEHQARCQEKDCDICKELVDKLFDEGLRHSQVKLNIL